MLKIYDVRSMFKINRQEWDVCGNLGWICEDESEICKEVVILDKMRFYRALETIAANPNDYKGMSAGQTLFRHRPYIEISNPHYLECERYYAKDAHTISYKLVCREKEGVTLEWIMEHLSAEKAIQYFKERGMSICPIKSP